MKKTSISSVKLVVIIVLAVICGLLIYKMTVGFENDSILDDANLLQQKTRIWGDLNDDSIEIIRRMTEPDIGFYPSKMKLFDYYDIIT